MRNSAELKGAGPRPLAAGACCSWKAFTHLSPWPFPLLPLLLSLPSFGIPGVQRKASSSWSLRAENRGRELLLALQMQIDLP